MARCFPYIHLNNNFVASSFDPSLDKDDGRIGDTDDYNFDYYDDDDADGSCC